MLKTTLLAAAALSFALLGGPTANAKEGHGHGGGGGGHHGGGGKHGGGGGNHGGGGKHGGGHGKHGGHYNKFRNYPFWLNYSWYPSCSYEPRKVRVKWWDRWGNPHFKWVWRDVKVCD